MKFQVKYFMRGKWHSEYPTHYITAVTEVCKLQLSKLPIDLILIIHIDTGEIILSRDLSD